MGVTAETRSHVAKMPMSSSVDVVAVDTASGTVDQTMRSADLSIR